MTARWLASHAGVSKSTLDRLESGQASDVLVSTVERLGAALGVTPDALLGYEGGPLVREPLTPDLLAASALEQQLPHLCQHCRVNIPASAMHTLGECMMRMSDNGDSDVKIGVLFNVPRTFVEHLLAGEHAARRKRMF